jgi:hypothetical protein
VPSGTLGEDRAEHDFRHVAAPLRDFGHQRPIAMELQPVLVFAGGAEFEAPAAGGEAAAVAAQAVQQFADQFRAGGDAAVLQGLVQPPQRDVQPIVLLRVRLLLLHHLEQCRLDGRNAAQPGDRIVFDPVADVGGQRDAFADQPGARHAVQRAQHLQRVRGHIVVRSTG